MVAELKSIPVQEEFGQGREIFGPFAERGQGQTDDVQAKEQVLAELTGFDRQPEILVRRGDDPHIDRHEAGAADAMKLLVLEDAQQFGL